jgi:catechol 2,3-dioxygenase-like lactoylglutathione lyase family enzyme
MSEQASNVPTPPAESPTHPQGSTLSGSSVLAGDSAIWSSSIGHIVFRVSDLKRAVGFYRDVVGLKCKLEDGDAWAAFDGGGATFALECRAAQPSSDRHGMQVCWKVSGDLDALVRHLRSAGVQVSGVEAGAHERRATVTDPDGNSFVLYSSLKQGKALHP